MLNVLCFYISTFWSMCALFSIVPLFHAFLVCGWGIIWMILRWFQLCQLLMGITFFLMFHIHCVTFVRSLCFRIILASFLITFLSPEIAVSISICDVLFIVRDGSQETMCLHFIFIPWWFTNILHCLLWNGTILALYNPLSTPFSYCFTHICTWLHLTWNYGFDLYLIFLIWVGH